MKPVICVIICTYNPRPAYLDRVLTALRQQNLSYSQWELLVIDNASDRPLSDELDLSWHPSARVIRESQLGLTYARLRGYQESRGTYLVYVDDDNVLEKNYLTHVALIFQNYLHLSAIAGKSFPEFEVEPEPWMAEYYPLLAIRDFGDETLMTAEGDRECPYYSPVGAGMAVRRDAFADYVEKATADTTRLALGRKGNQLSSCEDDDIVRTMIAAGWGVGYLPQLQLTHLIAAHRLQWKYLAKLVYSMGRSRIQALELHDVRIWQKIPHWTVPLRKIRTFFMYRAWSTPGYVRWRGACGTFEGLSSVTQLEDRLMQSLVSILVPCYNAERWLAETINSLQAQTWGNTEIIVVDDGSTDHSLAIAQSLQSPTVKVIHQPNRGASAARNRALQEAQGEWIQYLDADDLLSPEKIEHQVRLLQQHPPQMLAVCGTVHFFDGTLPEHGIYEDGLPFAVDSDQPLDWLIRLLGGEGFGGMVHPAAWLIPRTIADAAGFWNEALSLDDDGEYFARVVLNSAGIRRCESVVSYYRKYNTGQDLSAGRTASHFQSALRSLHCKAQQILVREDLPRTRTSLARCYMQLAILAYPDYPAITQDALAQVQTLGGTKDIPTLGGRGLELVKHLFGWKVARLSSVIYHRWKAQWSRVIASYSPTHFWLCLIRL